MLPISFDDVPYFNNEYRGDLIVTREVLYYFPHTRVGYSRLANELPGHDAAEAIGVLGVLVPVFGVAPWLLQVADKAAKFGKFARRNLRPSVNNARIRRSGLWSPADDNDSLQSKLDAHILSERERALDFSDDSVPKPMRFARAEMQNIQFGIKLTFDARFDVHDFRINLLRRSIARKALIEAGFL